MECLFQLTIVRMCGVVVLVLVCLTATGCSRSTRHQVLNFFFTGVPPLEAQQADPSPNEADMQKAVERSGEKQVSSRKNAAVAGKPASVPAVPQAPRFYSHTVWLEGNCAACHTGSKTFGFQSGGISGRNTGTRAFYSGGGMPGSLKLPKNKLCLVCHTDKSGLRAIRDNLWLHNTTAKGECMACHDAHQGRYPGVLRMEADRLCRSCHPEEKLASLPMHRTGSESCLSCHNPHMGADRRLLTREYQERKTSARREP